MDDDGPAGLSASSPRVAPDTGNVAGRHAAGPGNGFGQLWHKRYAARVIGQSDPVAAMTVWREEFTSFWPEGSRFRPAPLGITAGTVAAVELQVAPGAELATGVLVRDVTPTSFSLVTFEGHMFAGEIDYECVLPERGRGVIVAIDIRVRANDPLYELGLWLGGHARENRFWRDHLEALCARLGEDAPAMTTEQQRLDTHVQWRHAANIRQNAAIRTMVQNVWRLFTSGFRRFRHHQAPAA